MGINFMPNQYMDGRLNLGGYTFFGNGLNPKSVRFGQPESVKGKENTDFTEKTGPLSFEKNSGTPLQTGFGENIRLKWTANMTERALKRMGLEECQTCNSRKYQDESNDPGVSFKNPAHISPEAAPYTVRSHEQEHVVREKAKAEEEEREVVYQTVILHTSICPECGRVYISGGETRTVTRKEAEEKLNRGSEVNTRV